jgi:hypothetical protein
MIFTKSLFRRLRKPLKDSLNAESKMPGRSRLPQAAVKAAMEKSRRPRLRRAAIATGGAVGLTAASAGISSLRRRKEARGDS